VSAPLVSAEYLAEMLALLERLQGICDNVHDEAGFKVHVLGFDTRAKLKQAIRDTHDAWLEALRKEAV
jgi:hypothetical protein